MNDVPRSARSIFLEAAENIPPDKWPWFVAAACAGDEAQRREVTRLLAAHAELNSFMSQPAGELAHALDATLDGPAAEWIGQRVGRYKLMEQVGEGGMGMVFVAEQTEPVRRKVAIKIIKPGMDSREVIARFEAERQALALMDHPNIAKVLDAGTTEAGLPYFVMELIRGLQITKYCDQARLTPQQRLALFVTVCQAVQHAHQKGIIHRDLKPSNVLVTLHDGTPLAKVIDFGVAKALHGQLTPHTVYTSYSQMIGTPLYMSPEQAELSALDVDTRSDVYSLGVMLYELLTGQTPFDRETLGKAGLDELRRIIREVEPPRPSQRLSTLKAETLSTLSQERGVDQRRLRQYLRGELDWIVMKALEKDRTRRYESASAFAADVQRFLNHEAVEACPPSAAYRFRKFTRRNRISLTMAALVVLILLIAAGSGGWVVSDRELRQQRTAAAASTALDAGETFRRRGRWPEALEAARRAQALVAGGPASKVLVERVETTLADLEAMQEFEAIRQRQAEIKGDDFDVSRAGPEYAAAFQRLGIDVEALDVAEAARRIRARTIPAELAMAVEDWTACATESPNRKHLLAVALAADPAVWRVRMHDIIRANKGRAAALAELAASEEGRKMPALALDLLANLLIEELNEPELGVEVLRLAQRRYPADFWINLWLGYYLALELDPPQLDEGIRFLTAAAALNPDSAIAQFDLGRALQEAGKHALAEIAYRKAIDLKPDLAIAHNNLGLVFQDQKRWNEAVAAHREAIRHWPGDAAAHNNLGAAFVEQGRWDEAVAAFQKAVQIQPDLADAHKNLGAALERLGRFEEAIAAYQKTLRLDRKNAAVFNRLAQCFNAVEKKEEAATAFRQATLLEPNDADFHYNYANVLGDIGKLNEAIAEYRESIRLAPDQYDVHYNLSMILQRRGRHEEALAEIEKALELEPQDSNVQNSAAWLLATLPDPKLRDPARAVELATRAAQLSPLEGAIWNTLGLARYRNGQWQEAVSALKMSMRLREDGDSSDWLFLAMSHWRLGDKTEARKWYDRAVKALDEQESPDEELGRFRTEAAELLEIEDSPAKVTP